MVKAPLILAIDKPTGITSFDVIRIIKKNSSRPELGKIGHFGTLDPFASGLLIIGIRGATKLMNIVHSSTTKTYIATGKLGVSTDTGDITGVQNGEDKSEKFYQLEKLNIDSIQHQIESKFLGEYLQSPPAFSAAKFEGRPLYEWAREGKCIKKEAKKRHIYKIKILEFCFPYLKFEVTVGTGTYIRTLFEDMAMELGSIGTLETLQRSAIGQFQLDQAISMDDFESYASEHSKVGVLDHFGVSLGSLLPYPEFVFPEKETSRLFNGASICSSSQKIERMENFRRKNYSSEEENRKFWFFSTEGRILGLAEKMEEKYSPVVIFPH